MKDLEFLLLIVLSFLLSRLIIIYLKNKKKNSIIITNENFDKINLIKLIDRELYRNYYTREKKYLYYSIERILKGITKEEERKLKIFLKENKIKYKELDEELEKILKIKKEKELELELQLELKMEEKIRNIFL